MPTVTLFGYVCRDRNILPNGKSIEYAGGKGLFTGAALARLGVDTNLITWLPDSDHELLKALDGYPMRTEIIPIPTGTINTNSHVGDNTVATTIMDPFVIEPEHINESMRQLILPSDIVQISPDLGNKISLATIKFLRNKLKAKLSLDAGKYYRVLTANHELLPQLDWPDQADYLPYFHTIFFSEEDLAGKISSGQSLETVAQEIAAQGPVEVFITRGSKGSMLYDKSSGQIHYIPAFPPKKFVDPTGAGDTFIGAYLAYKNMGRDSITAAKLAAMAVSAKLCYPGPIRESAEEIESALASMK